MPLYENPSDYYMRVMQTDGQVLTDGLAARSCTTNGLFSSPTTIPPMLPPYVSSGSTTIVVTATGAMEGGRSSRSNSPVNSRGMAVSNSREITPWDVQGKWLKSPDAKWRQEQPSGWQQYCVLLKRLLQDSYKDKGKMLSGIIMEGTSK